MNKVIITKCIECKYVSAVPNPTTAVGDVCCIFMVPAKKIDNYQKEIPDWCSKLIKNF